MKKFTILALLSVCLYGCSGTSSVVEKRLFSNSGAAKDIDTEYFLVTESDLSEYFSNPTKSLKAQTFRSLFGKNTYFLVRMRDNGNLGVWGTLVLKIKVPSGTNKVIFTDTVTVSVKDVPRIFWGTWVIPHSQIFASSKAEEIPVIEHEWSEIYSK